MRIGDEGERREGDVRRGARRKFVRAVRVALVALVAWSLVAWAAARALVVSPDLGRADAVAVMAGSAAYLERTHHAAEIYREGRAARVLLTNDGELGGWSSAEQRNVPFVEIAARELQGRGVPAASVEFVPGYALGTYSEAQLLRRDAESRGLRSLIVVTSGYHSRRALWALQKAFAGSGVAVGVDAAPGEESPAPYLWWLTARGWREVAGEYAKLVYYRAHY
ncbi:MAG: YdcF family protein [Acidobacteria bacterium]|nr:YdcF family protein [Acidobacteriota bacterium]